MNYLIASINSWSLGVKTNIRILFPNTEKDKKVPENGYSVLYLLHGYSGDGSDWLRLSRLEHYLSKRQMVVVMPDGGKGFYTDMVEGDAYWTYLSEELPQFVRQHFPVSCERERTYAAGLSMGGYGAVKLALRCPQQYGKAVSFSGMLDVADMMEQLKRNPYIVPCCSVPPNLEVVFGDAFRLAEDKNDLFTLLQRVEPDECPRFKLYCGEADFLLNANHRFMELANQRELPCTLEQFQGGHEWDFWDRALERALMWLLE